MLEQLDGYSDLEFRDVLAFSGGAVCGSYRSADPFVGGGRFTPFVVWGDYIRARPTQADVAFFCSDESEEILRNDHGIGPIADQQANLLHIRRDLRLLESAVEKYRAQNFRLPSANEGLAALLNPADSVPQDANEFVGEYLEALPIDPWGRPYGFVPIGLGGGVTQQFDLYTLGANNTAGGVGEDADIRLIHLPYLDYVLPN